MNILHQETEFPAPSGTTLCRAILKELMATHRINATELARRINLPQPTIHRLLRGKTDDPKLSTLKLIANYFSITLDQLLGNTILEIGNSPKNPLHRSLAIPIISWTDAINAESFIANLAVTNWEEWLLVDVKASRSSFGLKSKRSMEPCFPTGSSLIIDPKDTPQDGDLVIVSYKGITEATIREIVLDGPKQQLHSINNGSIVDDLTSDFNILGVVIQTRFSYK